jgi:hypothetical protein
MVDWIRWLSLIFLFGGLFLLGRNSYHLKEAETFFVVVYLFCLVLTLIFTLSRGREKNQR